jgi:cell division protein FtsL
MRDEEAVMRVLKSTLAVMLALHLAAPGAWAAQQHAAGTATLDQMVAAEASTDDQHRQAVRDLLQRDEVRDIAKGAGLDLARAEAAVAVLDGAELEQLALQAQQVNEELAGGASVVVISTTTIIIVLLIILLIVALD